MDKASRKTSPECLRFFLLALRPGNDGSNDDRKDLCDINTLVDVLTKNGGYESVTAKEMVALAINDGFLVTVKTVGDSVISSDSGEDAVFVRLPHLEEVRVHSSDLYCYECNLPGILDSCVRCWRSFHRYCYRNNPAHPNYAVPSSDIQQHSLPVFSSEETDTEESNKAYCKFLNSSISSKLNNIDKNRGFCGLAVSEVNMLAKENDEANNMPNVYRQQIVTNAPVVLDGYYRSGMSPLHGSDIEEDMQDIDLCTCCRLLKGAWLRNPSNLHAEELCYLIRFTFSYNREWLANDVIEYFESKFTTNANEIELVKSLLIYSPVKRMDDIESKLKDHKYRLLTEVLVDLMDIQHNVGVFFGPGSTEMESTKWLVRDVAHDLSEIKRCPDCFRHSHEKKPSIWFAKPCAQQHELVYAKHSGFPYWPAKVIRILPHNKFDVRFFGGDHSRALVNLKFIKPIDTDVKSLKIGKSTGIKKAMHELHCHQLLSKYPSDAFGFHANPNQTNAIIRTVLESFKKTSTNKCLEKTRSKKSTSLGGMDENNSKVESCKKNPSPGVVFNIHSEVKVALKRRLSMVNKKETESIDDETPTNVWMTPNQDDMEVWDQMLWELQEAQNIINDYNQKIRENKVKKQKLQEEYGQTELQLKNLRQKQWCQWCLEEACYFCCFHAAYCSEVCQSHHWKAGHNTVCENKNI